HSRFPDAHQPHQSYGADRRQREGIRRGVGTHGPYTLYTRRRPAPHPTSDDGPEATTARRLTPQIEAFLALRAVERDASPHTLAAYGRDLADAETWLGDAGGLVSAPQEALEAWFADLSRRGLSAATAARRRASVRQFYRFALGEGWRADDPSRRPDAPK